MSKYIGVIHRELGVFSLNRFNIEHDKSSMRVTTDSLILGAAAELKGDEQRILDIGTGCGILALLMAQRTDHYPHPVEIDAIDIDLNSVKQAQQNIARSPWSDRMTAWQQDVLQYSAAAERGYDLIISNPPYFEAATPTRSLARQQARYTTTLSHRNLLVCAERLLTAHGRLVLILPYSVVEQLIVEKDLINWQIVYQRLIQNKQDAPYKLALLELARTNAVIDNCCIETLTIKNKAEQYTQQYYQLLAPYKPFNLNKVAEK